MPQETDWKAVLVDIKDRIGGELKSERTMKDSLAQQIGYEVVQNPSADTSASVARIKQMEAKIEGLDSGMTLISGYLNGTYVLPKQT